MRSFFLDFLLDVLYKKLKNLKSFRQTKLLIIKHKVNISMKKINEAFVKRFHG